jgi:hypothetical protein
MSPAPSAPPADALLGFTSDMGAFPAEATRLTSTILLRPPVAPRSPAPTVGRYH